MSLPRAVIEAEKRSDEILASLQAQANPQPMPDPQPDGEEAASEAQPQAQEAPAQQEDPTWQARYTALIGKYNAEVPRLAATNKELRTQLDDLKREVERMKAAPQESLVKPEEVAEFGEPLVDLIRRAAREEVTAKDREIAELRARLDNHETTTSQSKTDKFYADLSAAVPDWGEINENKAFLAWLGEYDEFAGRTRQQLLGDAEQALDARRVAKFFDSWKKTQTNRQQQSSASLESQVVPDASRATTPPPAKKIWTRGEIAQVYAMMREGRISDKDAAAYETAINEAVTEGRIR